MISRCPCIERSVCANGAGKASRPSWTADSADVAAPTTSGTTAASAMTVAGRGDADDGAGTAADCLMGDGRRAAAGAPDHGTKVPGIPPGPPALADTVVRGGAPALAGRTRLGGAVPCREDAAVEP